MLQMLPRGLCDYTFQLCSLGGHPLLQTSFLSTFQGEGKLQPLAQVRVGQARCWSTARTTSLWFLLIAPFQQRGFEGESWRASCFYLKPHAVCYSIYALRIPDFSILVSSAVLVGSHWWTMELLSFSMKLLCIKYWNLHWNCCAPSN